MATLSLKTIAKNRLGKTGPLSVNDDVFGYVYRNGGVFGPLAGDTLPGTGLPTGRALGRHLAAISGKSIDLVLILVGYETDSTVSAVSPDDLTKIQYAVQVMRDLYAQAPLGIRVLNWQRIALADAEDYVDIEDHEAWLHGVHIPEYTQGTWTNHSARRKRKLLLNRDEIEKIERKVNEKGFTIVPTSLYFKDGRAKVEIALAKGKKTWDKRHSLAERQADREKEQALGRRLKGMD